MKKKNNTIENLEKQYLGFSQVLEDKNDIYDHDFQKNNELYEGKIMIAEEINQIEGTSNIKVTDYRLADLITILVKSIINKEEQMETINKHVTQTIENQNQQFMKEIDNHKEWQKHLENENEQLNSKIEEQKHIQQKIVSQMNEHNDLRKDYIEIKVMYDNLYKENMHLKILVEDYQQQLNKKHNKITDDENLIKVLKSNLIEQSKQFEKVNLRCINEKEKIQNIEYQTKQMIEKHMVQIHKKDNSIVLLQEENSVLKYHIDSIKTEIDSLKHNVNTLEYELKDKNITIKNMLRKPIQQHQYTSTQFNNLLHTLSKLEQQMDITLDDLYICKKKLVSYENIFEDMQNIIQQQSITRNKWIVKNKKVKYMANKKITKNVVDEKKDTLVTKVDNLEDELKNEIQDLKNNLKLKSSAVIITENIAKLQLKEASNTIQNFSRINIAQSIELNDLRNKVSTIKYTQVLPHTNNRHLQQMECMIDLLRKLKLENKMMKKMCKCQN